MPEQIGAVRDGPTHHPVGSLIIVGREQKDLFHALVEEFRKVGPIEVLLDRRLGERRRRVTMVVDDRRARERRSLPRLEDDLRARRYILVRPRYRRPSD